MKNHLLASLLLLVLLFSVAPGALGEEASAPEITPDTVVTFYDQNFEAEIRYMVWKEERPILVSDVSNIIHLDVDELGITDLRGIAYFASLRTLHCNGNRLKALDVSKNTELVHLECYDNRLTELDVSHNSKLETLDCSENQLAGLQVIGATGLKELLCYDNQLKALDISQNAALTKLNCENNKLEALDVSQNAVLSKLYCQGNFFPDTSAILGLDARSMRDFKFGKQGK